MNELKVRGKLVKDVYMGNSKSGPYAAGTLEIPDGDKYHQWLEFYAPGPACANALNRARVGDSFELLGSLSEKKKQDGTRIKQMRVTIVRQAGQAAPPVANSYADQGITDSDIPF